MFSLKNSPLNKNPKQDSNPGFSGYPSSNPFDSDDEIYSNKNMHNTPHRTSFEPARVTPKLSTNPFDDGDEGTLKSILVTRNDFDKHSKYKNDETNTIRNTHNTPHRTFSEPARVAPKLSTNPFDQGDEGTLKSLSVNRNNYEKRNKYKNGFREYGGLENQTVQDVDEYAVHRAEETTKNVNSCLKIAEDIREDATKTLVLLHHQGEQITKTHTVAVDIDNDLSRGEKLLGALGGLFSRTWKPIKTRTITGPVIIRDEPVRSKANHFEQRERLGLKVAQKEQSNTRTSPVEPTNMLQKVELEKAKQDDALSDLSNLLDELKDMAVDMGSEINRQNKALDPFMDDVEELNFRVRGANQRGRRLLGK